MRLVGRDDLAPMWVEIGLGRQNGCSGQISSACLMKVISGSVNSCWYR